MIFFGFGQLVLSGLNSCFWEEFSQRVIFFGDAGRRRPSKDPLFFRLSQGFCGAVIHSLSRCLGIYNWLSKVQDPKISLLDLRLVKMDSDSSMR